MGGAGNAGSGAGNASSAVSSAGGAGNAVDGKSDGFTTCGGKNHLNKSFKSVFQSNHLVYCQ